MHGLVNRTLQNFLQDTYGNGVWWRVADLSGVAPAGFEAMLHYPEETTERLLAAAETVLEEPRPAVLEDVGTYLVSNPRTERFRRLLRLTGADLTEFIAAIEDLPGRVRLAVADLTLPPLMLEEHGRSDFTLTCGPGIPGLIHVLTGLLRAMADDYGALVLLTGRGPCKVDIQVLDQTFASGRAFDLAACPDAGDAELGAA